MGSVANQYVAPVSGKSVLIIVESTVQRQLRSSEELGAVVPAGVGVAVPPEVPGAVLAPPAGEFVACGAGVGVAPPGCGVLAEPGLVTGAGAAELPTVVPLPHAASARIAAARQQAATVRIG